MLTEKEMFCELQKLWHAMSDERMDFPVYFEEPRKGWGYKGGGEYYLFIRGNTYILSYSERGTAHAMAESEDFDDIRFEVAMTMASEIVSILLRKNPNLICATFLPLRTPRITPVSLTKIG